MKHKIMVVDDDAHVRATLDSILRAAGFDVIAAGDGESALEKARSDVPSLIILDLMLPRTPGLEVCQLLKIDDKTSHIPIIMLTAQAKEGDKIAGLQFGADDYVTKPFSPRELVLRINRSLPN